MSYLENSLLYNQLLCGCKISDLVSCDELAELYCGVGLEIGDAVSS